MQSLNSKPDTDEKGIHELDNTSKEVTQNAPLGEKVVENIKILVKGYGNHNETLYIYISSWQCFE